MCPSGRMSRIWPWRAEKTDWTFIARLSQNFNAALRPGGTICFEFGYGQETGVGELLEAAGFTDVMFRKDLRGVTRAVAARKPE